MNILVDNKIRKLWSEINEDIMISYMETKNAHNTGDVNMISETAKSGEKINTGDWKGKVEEDWRNLERKERKEKSKVRHIRN